MKYGTPSCEHSIVAAFNEQDMKSEIQTDASPFGKLSKRYLQESSIARKLLQVEGREIAKADRVAKRKDIKERMAKNTEKRRKLDEGDVKEVEAIE